MDGIKTLWGRNRRAGAWLLFGLTCLGLLAAVRQYDQGLQQTERNSLLLDAAAANQAVQVRELLRAGADPNIRLPSDTPPPPVWQSMAATVQRLWRHQSPAPREVPSTALLVAIGSHDQTSRPQLETVRALLDAGANPNTPGPLPPSWGSVDTPLAWAVRASQPQIVRLLLDKHADASVRDQDGIPCLSLAAGGGWRGGQNTQSVALLLAHGVDANARNAEGWTPLISAAAAIHISPAVLKLLLDHGAAVSAQGQDGETALVKLVAYHRSLDKSEELAATVLLLNAGADVNARNCFRLTPLMLASSGGQIATAQMLVAHGADRAARDAKGHTALDRVRASDMSQINSNLKRDFITLLSKKPL